MTALAGTIYQARVDLTDTIPLYVYLVKGAEYAVWIDSGVKSMFQMLLETMDRASVHDRNLRFILHTHSHHDHIGCNAQMKNRTSCLIAAHRHYATWHSDFEQHYQEFARAFPDLVPDTPALRDEVLSILDEPRPVDVFIEEGTQFNLGGGVSLRAISLPGHMLAEFGWYETATRTLILGDAITGLDWPLFHSHLSVSAYRNSLERIRALLSDLNISQVICAHFPPLTPAETVILLDKAHLYLDSIETTLIRIIAEGDVVTLETLWHETCKRMGRVQEFRALNMVFAHVQDLLARSIIREVGYQQFALK